MTNETTLAELGERAVIEDLLRPRYGGGSMSFGDDCATLRIPAEASHTLATTDPCPYPAAALLGFTDYYYWGWLLATINLSDLAAGGARPSGILSSLVLPGDFSVRNFLRILDGLDECSAKSGTGVVGGNLKEGSAVDLAATAIGYTTGPPLGRTGASAEDVIILLGSFGLFWAGFLGRYKALEMPSAHLASSVEAVLKPEPKTELGILLRERALVTSCLDNSDGLYSSMEILSRANSAGVRLDLSRWELCDEAVSAGAALGVEPHRLGLGWGDWQLVVTARPGQVSAVREAASNCGIASSVIGELVEGSGVVLDVGSTAGPLMRLDSQRFTADSWFTAGIDEYVHRLLTSPLVIN